MLRVSTVAASWQSLLESCRPAFRRAPTFAVFVVLATGLVAQPARRTVVRMLAGAGAAAALSFHTACRFFSHHAWEVDRIGVLLARLIVDRLLGPGAAIEVVVDDTLIRRWGRRVFGAFWTHDGSAQDPGGLGRGNRWIIAGIVVMLPFCSHPVCLPVLLRLWRGKGTDSPVRLAGDLISVLAQQFPDRDIHVVGDAAYHGKPLLVTGTTVTTRLPVNAALYAPAPPRTGRRGRPRRKGHRLGTPAEIAATAAWRPRYVKCHPSPPVAEPNPRGRESRCDYHGRDRAANREHGSTSRTGESVVDPSSAAGLPRHCEAPDRCDAAVSPCTPSLNDVAHHLNRPTPSACHRHPSQLFTVIVNVQPWVRPWTGNVRQRGRNPRSLAGQATDPSVYVPGPTLSEPDTRAATPSAGDHPGVHGRRATFGDSASLQARYPARP